MRDLDPIQPAYDGPVDWGDGAASEKQLRR